MMWSCDHALFEKCKSHESKTQNSESGMHNKHIPHYKHASNIIQNISIHIAIAGMSCILQPIPGDTSKPEFFPTQVCLAVGFLGMFRPRPDNGFPDATTKRHFGCIKISYHGLCMLTRLYIYICSRQFPHLINGDGIYLATILNLECCIARCFAMAGRTAIETKVPPACHRIRSLMVWGVDLFRANCIFYTAIRPNHFQVSAS